MENENKLKELVAPLLWWYDENRRILPWREEPTPYRVWISEIMLQQTRVEAGKGYFERFVKELPDVEALANVEDQQLMKLWEGLGYYNRARNLKKAAGIVMEKHSGRMPDTVQGLLELPGIGSYTAGAVASIAYGLPAPAVDGNVLRVLARIESDERDILSAAVKKDREKKLLQIMPEKRPGDFNQALMELGALVCLPNGEPLCEKCPVQSLCRGYLNGTAAKLPVKKAKKARIAEEKTMLLLCCKHRLALQKRPDKGLLRGLMELPSLPGHLTAQEVESLFMQQGEEPDSVKELGEAKHIFSHVEWRMQGIFVALNREYKSLEFLGERPFFWVSEQELAHQVALPTAFKYYLDCFLSEEKKP